VPPPFEAECEPMSNESELGESAASELGEDKKARPQAKMTVRILKIRLD